MADHWTGIAADCRTALSAWLLPTPEPEALAATQALEQHQFDGLIGMAGYVAELMFRGTLNYEGARQLADACYEAIPANMRDNGTGSAGLAHDMMIALLTEPYRDDQLKSVVKGGVHGQKVTEFLLVFARTAMDFIERRRGVDRRLWLREWYTVIRANEDRLIVFTDPMDLLGRRLHEKDIALVTRPERPQLPPGAIGHLYVHATGERQLVLAPDLKLKYAESLQIFKLVLHRLDRLEQGNAGEDSDWQVREDGSQRILLGDVSDDLPPI